eukprot:2901043-Pyramimonas_sp.AAC.1
MPSGLIRVFSRNTNTISNHKNTNDSTTSNSNTTDIGRLYALIGISGKHDHGNTRNCYNTNIATQNSITDRNKKNSAANQSTTVTKKNNHPTNMEITNAIKIRDANTMWQTTSTTTKQ